MELKSSLTYTFGFFLGLLVGRVLGYRAAEKDMSRAEEQACKEVQKWLEAEENS